MFNKNKMIASLLVLGCTVPVMAQAGSLAITNNTNSYVTSKVNNTICSSRLPIGRIITSPHSTTNIDEWKITAACSLGGSPSKCAADVYMNNDCQGAPVASVKFDINKGILSIDPNAANPDASKYAFAYNNTAKTYYATLSEK